MILIIGGAYQGKLDFAKEEFQVEDHQILKVDEIINTKFDEALGFALIQEMNQSLSLFLLKTLVQQIKTKKIIVDLDRLIRFLIKEEKSEEWIKDFIAQIDWTDKIITFTDHSQGIVPIDREDRLFRDISGRVMTMMSKKATKVYRVFCGIPERLK